MSWEANIAASRTGRIHWSGAASARLYRRLLADILHGALPPGRQLKLPPLADTYGTSTATVREVIILLAADRWVVREAAGFHVAPASQADLFELIKTVSWLEEIGLRESIANGDQHWEGDLLVAHRALSRCPAPDATVSGWELAAYEEHLLDYHDALIGACGSSFLIARCIELNQHLLRYRNLAAAIVSQSECERDGLLAICGAALQRDKELAVNLLRGYFKTAMSIVLTSAVLN